MEGEDRTGFDRTWDGVLELRSILVVRGTELRLDYIRPDDPVENAFIESFHVDRETSV
jgi:hypothetical protein